MLTFWFDLIAGTSLLAHWFQSEEKADREGWIISIITSEIVVILTRDFSQFSEITIVTISAINLSIWIYHVIAGSIVCTVNLHLFHYFPKFVCLIFSTTGVCPATLICLEFLNPTLSTFYLEFRSTIICIFIYTFRLTFRSSYLGSRRANSHKRFVINDWFEINL